MSRPVLLRPVPAADPQLPRALEQALDDGPPVLVLPEDPATAARLLSVAGVDRPVTEPDTAVVVGTSGSTGEPKAVVLSRAAIRASVAATEQRLGGPSDWTLTLPTSGVAGLMVVARAVLGGGRLRHGSSDLADPALAVDGDTPHTLSVVPTQLHRILADEDALARLARYRTVLVGGAAADAALLDHVRGRGVAVVTTYGMSETCGGCVYDGVPLDGVAVGIDVDDQRIRLTTPAAFTGYLRRPDLTAAVLSGGVWTGEVPGGPGTVRTEDRGRLEDGRLRVLGRLDDIVVSGGSNVDLAEVERVARQVLGTDRLAVTSRPDPQWGAEVVLVLSAGAPVWTLPEIRDRLRPVLAPAGLPRVLLRLDRLPLLPNGKLDRVGLASRAAEPGAA